MTGWYCGTVWIGHDNYKSLASKTTGGNSAAALWQSFMSKIHRQKGLSNRDILSGSGEEYGLVKVTTCKYSGKLATDACRDDGVESGWWPRGYVPTEYCDMHVQQTVCVDSGMVAGPYCTNTETRGVVSLPVGHPLAKFLNTEYQDVLTKYLGTSILNGAVCTWHTMPAYQPDPDPWYDPGYADPGYTDPGVGQPVWPDAQEQEIQSYVQDLRRVISYAQKKMGSDSLPN